MLTVLFEKAGPYDPEEKAFEFIKKYREWTMSNKKIGTSLRTYFPDAPDRHIYTDWNNYTQIIAEIFKLAFQPAKATEAIGNIRNYEISTNLDSIDWDG